jgi:hypothetical protein
MIAIMELSQQQLSKQDHYDYGLRSFVIPISRAAGAMKRTDPDAPEEVGFLNGRLKSRHGMKQIHKLRCILNTVFSSV